MGGSRRDVVRGQFSRARASSTDAFAVALGSRKIRKQQRKLSKADVVRLRKDGRGQLEKKRHLLQSPCLLAHSCFNNGQMNNNTLPMDARRAPASLSSSSSSSSSSSFTACCEQNGYLSWSHAIVPRANFCGLHYSSHSRAPPVSGVCGRDKSSFIMRGRKGGKKIRRGRSVKEKSKVRHYAVSSSNASEGSSGSASLCGSSGYLSSGGSSGYPYSSSSSLREGELSEEEEEEEEEGDRRMEPMDASSDQQSTDSGAQGYGTTHGGKEGRGWFTKLPVMAPFILSMGTQQKETESREKSKDEKTHSETAAVAPVHSRTLSHIPRSTAMETEAPNVPQCGEVDHRHRDLVNENPLQWSREKVFQWLDSMAEHHSIPSIKKSLFSMNGLGVALISRSGFVRRVGEKGVALHQDYHKRLKRQC